VTQLGLGVATNDLVLLGALKEELVLFGAALFAEGDLKEEGAHVSIRFSSLVA
jgi:hypothetical protein